MVASSSRWVIGVIGERQEWPMIALFLDRWSRRGRLGHKMLAIVWLVALTEEPEMARGPFMRSAVLFLCPRVCNGGMAVVSGK
jgi:hypothetical protein